MRKINYLFYLMSVAIVSNCYGQDMNPVVSRIISPSPTASSIARYGDVPVNECTGIPNIDIPLCQASANGFTLPVSLSYYAGGIKVEERAPWTGLGWSLRAGGMISRVVRGKPDESGYTGNDGALIPANGAISQYTASGFNLLRACLKLCRIN
jgi:hypothetical protein